MKQIATIGLALVPLLAGCAADTLGPGKASDTARLDAQSIPNIENQLKKLKWRVRSLKRQVAQQRSSGGRVNHNELRDIRKRVSELETLNSNLGPRGGASTPQGRADAMSPAAEARFASLEAKLRRLEASQTRRATAGAPSASRASQGTAALRKDQDALAKRFDKMEQELERDRTLVVDFLEDLDKRLGALEGPDPGASGAAPTPPKQP